MKKTIFLTIVSALVLSSCQKAAKADFSTNKAVYAAGETVILTNHSGDADSYRWTLPGGLTSTELNTHYTISPDLDNTALTFKLETFSKNGKHSSVFSRSIPVQASGQATIWASGYGGFQRDVYVDDVLVGSTKMAYDSVLHNYPPGHVHGWFSVGVHQVVVKANNVTEAAVGMYMSKGDSMDVRP